MIRVLHVFGRLHRGGAESRTMDIYRNIDRARIQFDFIVHTPDECAYDAEAISLGARIFRFPRFRGVNYFSYRAHWRKFLAEHPEYQAAHIHTTNFAICFLPLLKGLKMRVTHARSASDSSLIKRWIVILSQRRIKKHSTHLLAVSRKAADFAFGKTNGKAIVVPNAIDAGKYALDLDIRDAMRKGMGLENRFVLGHVGRFTQEKNHAFLIDICRELQKTRPDMVLLCAGDGPLMEAVRERCAAEKINASFLGLRDDIPAIMQAMDVFLLPSFYEGLPGAAIEAQAAGLPCFLSERITDECAVIPNLCEFLPIASGARIWSDAIASCDTGVRENTYGQIKKQGYDIQTQAPWYENFYRNGIENGG